MNADFERFNRQIIKVGNSYAVAITPSKATKFGFELGVKVQVGIRNGLIVISREDEKQLDINELMKSDTIREHQPLIKANEQDLQGLNELASELGNTSFDWVNQRIYGYNSNLRLGDKKRRAVIRRKQVVVLNLDLMTITYFPENINGDKFPALRGLRMASCQLRDVDLSSLSTLPSLEKLVLSNNEIDEIDLSALSNLKKMSELHLDGNLIDQINLSPLKDLKMIETLSLSGNELEVIDLSPLKELRALKEFYLDNNYLEEIDLTPLSNKRGLFLSLENNPLKVIDLEPLFDIEDLHIGLPRDLSNQTREQVRVLQEKGVELSVKPLKKLTTGEIFNLPFNLQDTAITMLSLVEGTVDEIAKAADIPVSDVLPKIETLQMMRYIGKIQKGGETVYFRSK
ncbi:MAG: leucine-rich repeat domain-containing protein [Candidatus Hodarchaeales archaeon]|jgi:antitoxin component of MazEF toxin-antitoxin module